MILNLQKELTINDLSRYREFIIKHLELIEKRKNILKKQCTPDFYAKIIKPFEVQEEYLKRKLRSY